MDPTGGGLPFPNSYAAYVPDSSSSSSSSSNTSGAPTGMNPSNPAQQQAQQQQHTQPANVLQGSPANKYQCRNCGKAFARDDLLRRHLAREARAQAQPQYDRQKSCYECARSKARCDLAVPSCGRCRNRGKTCHYGARSGNPNVRRQRESMAPPSNLMAMNISSSSQDSGMYGANWPQSDYSSDASGTPDHRRYSESESESESGSISWSENNQADYSIHERPSRTNSISSNSSSTSFHSTDDGFARHQQGFQVVPDAVTPNTFLAANNNFQPLQHHQQQMQLPSHQHQQRLAAQTPLMTNLDRSAPQYKNEEGEETPIGRMVNAYTAATSSVDPRSGQGMQQQMASTTAVQLPDSGATDTTTSATGLNQALGGGWPAQTNPASSALDLNTGSGAPQELMGPPSLPFVNRPGGARASQKPQPHPLLTGANMPQPNAPHNAPTTSVSGRPLFSAMFDLSGWLEEPVVPSPLYPTGPSFSSLGAAIPTGSLAQQPIPEMDESEVTPPQDQQQHEQLLQSAFSTPHQGQQGQQSTQQTLNPSSEMPASRYWWANPPSQSDAFLMHSVAQATATHLSHYPHLMVLPDPSSPVPPTVHRPWMAHIRGNIPAPLAVARVVLAGFAVRLPASEHVVWEGVARETQRIIVAHETICATGSDLDVFGATVALFFYCLLLMMCTDAGASGHVTMELTNSAFFGLSQLSKSLSVRLHNAQNRRVQEELVAAQQGFSTDDEKQNWMTWGFEETMRRTLWAAYAILVLQRFRDGAVLSEGHLAGVDLLLDIHLPATAAEFEAESEEAWRKARADNRSESAGDSSNFTFRDLIIHRPKSTASTPEPSGFDAGNATQGTTPQSSQTGTAPEALLSYFDKHDAFVATVLSIAFCLDSSLTTTA
ncbi:unnamed protein product [Sympodiomycopsis kandeliae]